MEAHGNRPGLVDGKLVKLRKDSFASRLTPAQRDELFTALAGGKGLVEAAAMVHDWTKSEWSGRPPSGQAISAWFQGAKVERRFLAAKESALVAQANCPADYDEQARRALGQAKFLATLEDLSPMDIAFLEKNELAKQKLDLDRQKLAMDVRITRRNLALDRNRILLERARGGERGEGLQKEIDLALDEINRLKRGEDAP
jgi:hypothetical protein